MHKLLLTSAIIGTLGFAALPANAMSANMMSGAQPLPLAASGQPEVTLVSGGCGPFRHRGWNGFCYPGGGFYGGYGYYGGYRPWGWHRPWGWGGYGWHRGWHRW